MVDPHDTAPEDLDARVQKLVKRAATLAQQEIALEKPDLVTDYARVVVAAEAVVSYREKSLEETRQTAVAVAAAERGISEEDTSKDETEYAAARKAQQAIHNSAKGIASRLARFEAVLKPRYRLLQVDVAAKFPLESLMASVQSLKEFAAATRPHPHNLAKVKFEKSEMSLTEQGHTFLWWQTCIADYAGKWADMHALARCWHLTNAKDLATFQRLVRRSVPSDIIQGRTWFLRCPPWATPKQRP